MRRIFALTLLGSLLLAGTCGFATVALAQSDIRTEGEAVGARGLYEAEVPVNSQSDEDRTVGFARALAVVLGRLSGERDVAARPGVSTEMRNARQYVTGYDYRQDQGTSPSGAPTFGTTLVARFDPEEVQALAEMLALPVWPQPRPKPVVWLGIDDGSGPRLVSLAHANAARPLLNRATERGFSLGLPAGNAAEQAAVGAIWRQDTAAVARTSSRYNPPMQLIGKLYRNQAGWTADWVFVDDGRVLSKWSVSDPDARRAMASGADGAADALIKRYARQATGGAASTQRVVFEGIHSTEDFLRLSAALQSTSVVRRITPVKATATTLVVDLDLLSGLAGFQRRMSADDAPFVGGEGDPPVYRLK